MADAEFARLRQQGQRIGPRQPNEKTPPAQGMAGGVSRMLSGTGIRMNCCGKTVRHGHSRFLHGAHHSCNATARTPRSTTCPGNTPGGIPRRQTADRHPPTTWDRRWQRSCVGRNRLNRTTGRYVMADKIGNGAQINPHVFGTGRLALRSTVRIFPSQIPALAPSVGTIGRWTCPNRTNLEQHAP